MNKWSLRIGLGLFGLIVLTLMCIFIRSSINGRVDESALKLERANISAAANGFDVLQSATNRLWWPDKLDERLNDLAKDTNWDGNLAAMVLATNREALAAWDAAGKLPDFQVPQTSTVDELMPYLPKWKEFALLAQVRDNALLHDGKDEEGFDQIVNEIRMGRRMQDSRGVLIVYLVGVAVETLGLNQLQHWAGKVNLTADQLKDYIRQIEPAPGAEAAAYANVIRAEYWVDVGTLNAMRRGELTNSEASEDFPRHGMVWPIFDFRQTRAHFAKDATALVKAAPKYYKDANVDVTNSPPSTASLILSGNPVGEIFYSLLTPTLATSLATKSRIDVQVRATQTILALRAYQLTHGKLPENLDALVPEFLDKVPVDAFNGQPLRYSPEKKIVYSVGQNLKDDGGNDHYSPYQNKNHLDLVYPFDF